MNDRKFEIRCNASEDGQLHVKTNSFSIRASQLIRRNGAEEMWDSVLILCQLGEDGVLTTKVVVCHPDWEEHLQVANIQSLLPQGDTESPVLAVDLTPVRL